MFDGFFAIAVKEIAIAVKEIVEITSLNGTAGHHHCFIALPACSWIPAKTISLLCVCHLFN
jgi:hypothetical protein